MPLSSKFFTESTSENIVKIDHIFGEDIDKVAYFLAYPVVC